MNHYSSRPLRTAKIDNQPSISRQAAALVSPYQADDFVPQGSREDVVEKDEVVAADAHGTTSIYDTNNQPVIHDETLVTKTLEFFNNAARSVTEAGLQPKDFLFNMTPTSPSKRRHLDQQSTTQRTRKDDPIPSTQDVGVRANGGERRLFYFGGYDFFFMIGGPMENQ